MAENLKVLGQLAPSATTATTLYTAPSSTQAAISVITVCNRGAATATFRVAVRPDGASLANQHYLIYDATIPPKDTLEVLRGLTIGDTDVITVYASTADFSFSAFGSEVTQ